MGMATAREEALEAIRGMPDSSSWDDILHEINFRREVARGIEEIESGRTISHDEVKRMFK